LGMGWREVGWFGWRFHRVCVRVFFREGGWSGGLASNGGIYQTPALWRACVKRVGGGGGLREEACVWLRKMKSKRFFL